MTELQRRVSAQVEKALEKHRPRMIRECWEPSAKKSPTPAKLAFPIRFGFNAQGKLIVYSVNDVPDPNRADVSSCLRELKLALEIEPPGQMVGVQLEVALP